jgi:hypothetical protein
MPRWGETGIAPRAEKGKKVTMTPLQKGNEYS